MPFSALIQENWPACLPDPEQLALPGALRREAGRHHFTEALNHLLKPISHPQLSDLADWACNESGSLHTSQISHLRNNKMRMLGTKSVDALGRLNQAAWIFQHRPELRDRLGTAALTPRIEAILEVFAPLLDPRTQLPLGSGEFLYLYLGYLRLPIEPPLVLDQKQKEQLAERIGIWLDQQLSARGLSFRDASSRIRLAWSGETAGADRLVRVISGLEDYSARDLAGEWERITATAAAVLERPLTPRSLAEELLGGGLEVGSSGAKTA
ncbi:hypothetical protein NZK32_17195 [Cyanobium sp. FGCU-52]|nr:hypothetical protein [Cyanobium sp. FGCU52]